MIKHLLHYFLQLVTIVMVTCFTVPLQADDLTIAEIFMFSEDDPNPFDSKQLCVVETYFDFSAQNASNECNPADPGNILYTACLNNGGICADPGVPPLDVYASNYQPGSPTFFQLTADSINQILAVSEPNGTPTFSDLKCLEISFVVAATPDNGETCDDSINPGNVTLYDGATENLAGTEQVNLNCLGSDPSDAQCFFVGNEDGGITAAYNAVLVVAP